MPGVSSRQDQAQIPIPAIVEHPLVVVGVPVFNEARYLQECLDSLQAQTWTDFAVLIADNGSSDGSERIAAAMCEKDRRFRLHRHDANIGALGNWEFLLDATLSPLFMWLGAHDVLHPEFLAETIAAHRRSPAISLAYTLMEMTDPDGAVECLLENRIAARTRMGPMGRYLHAYRHVQGYEVNHLIRRSAAEDFNFRTSYAWDIIFLAHLAFHGPFTCIERHLYSVRNVHPRRSETEQETMKRLTGASGRGHNVGETLDHVSEDFTRLSRGRHGWRLWRSLVRGVVTHRWSPRGLGRLSQLLHLTAPIRQMFAPPIVKSGNGGKAG